MLSPNNLISVGVGVNPLPAFNKKNTLCNLVIWNVVYNSSESGIPLYTCNLN